MPSPSAIDVLDAVERFVGQLHCGSQNAGLETLIDVDLSFSQAKSLYVLSQSPAPIPINELADGLRLSVAATGRNVEQLVRHGFVDRQEDPRDRRVKRICLTPAGHDLIATFRSQQRENALEFIQTLPQDDRDRLLSALRPIIDRFPPPPQPTSAAPADRLPAETAATRTIRAQEQLV